MTDLDVNRLQSDLLNTSGQQSFLLLTPQYANIMPSASGLLVAEERCSLTCDKHGFHTPGSAMRSVIVLEQRYPQFEHLSSSTTADILSP
jgi:hypothetical protein